MRILSEPLYEVKQDSDYYKDRIKEIEIRDVFQEELLQIEKDVGLDSRTMAVWSYDKIGIEATKENKEKYASHVKVSQDSGYLILKKRSALYKGISEKLKLSCFNEMRNAENPFAVHNIFGMNNIAGSQVVYKRWFVEVKDETRVDLSYCEKVDWDEYIALIQKSRSERTKEEAE